METSHDKLCNAHFTYKAKTSFDDCEICILINRVRMDEQSYQSDELIEMFYIGRQTGRYMAAAAIQYGTLVKHPIDHDFIFMNDAVRTARGTDEV